MDTVINVLLVLGLLVLIVVACALVGFVVFFILITLWALIKPHISLLIDMYLDWFDKRTDI